jgi:hypothetical protein
MPILNADALSTLRDQQKYAARIEQRCPKRTGQTWPNYCCECDEFFIDGHYPTCADVTEHQTHRRY